MEKDEVTEPNVSVELEAASDLLLALWRQLKEREEGLRVTLRRARLGAAKTPAIDVAKTLRAAADMLIDRGGKLHETARRIEPDTRRRRNKTPPPT